MYNSISSFNVEDDPTIPKIKRQPGRFDVVWYAIRITYSREMLFKEFLDASHIESFIPMHYETVRMRNGKEIRRLVPIIHNLIFVRTTKTCIDDIMRIYANKYPIRYIMDKYEQKPIIVPNKQMQDFIAVNGTYTEQLVHLDPSEVALKKGVRVRIKGGICEGIEGEYMRIAGDRRVVVSIKGVMAIGTAFVHPSLIEVID
jgi:transcription antitermination factor NusG